MKAALLVAGPRLDAELAQDEPERLVVVAPSLASDAEVDEEDDGAGGGQPAVELVDGDGRLAASPVHRWNMLDASEVEVGVGPADPGAKRLRRGVQIDAVDRDGDHEEQRGGRKGHETEVPPQRERRALGGEKLVELRPAPVELEKGEYCEEIISEMAGGRRSLRTYHSI